MSFWKRLFGQQQTGMDTRRKILAMTDQQLESMLQDDPSNWTADALASAKAELKRRRTGCGVAPDTSSAPVASAPPQTPVPHGGEGISKLLRCFRDEVSGEEMRTLLSEAVGDFQAEGAAGSRALAALIRDLLKCRSRKICSALSIAKELEPTSELISEIKAVQSASQIVDGAPGEFAPEILGGNQIGWTNFTHARVRDFAKEAIETLSTKLNEEPSSAPKPASPPQQNVPAGRSQSGASFTEKAKQKAAKWWAEQLMNGTAEQKALFEAGLLAQIPDSGDWILYVDYDPCKELLAAVRGAGIECSGVTFSATGILPMKTAMVYRNGNLLIRDMNLPEDTSSVLWSDHQSI